MVLDQKKKLQSVLIFEGYHEEEENTSAVSFQKTVLLGTVDGNQIKPISAQ